MIHFTEDCLLGIEMIDDDHRHLFELLYEADELLGQKYCFDQYDRIKSVLTELKQYSDEHFAREEAYMESIHDSELLKQRLQHNLFRDKINSLDFSSYNEDEEQAVLLEELVQFLARWLYHHIISSDTLIGKMNQLDSWLLQENPCEFRKEYWTGIEFVDYQHKRLFEIVDEANQLIQKFDKEDCVDEFLCIISELMDYTKFHFKAEEEYMESIQYEGLEAQKRAHSAFIQHIGKISKNEIQANGKEQVEELVEYLLSWLINHILRLDKMIPELK